MTDVFWRSSCGSGLSLSSGSDSSLLSADSSIKGVLMSVVL